MQTLLDILQGFNGKTITVVGDLVLDKYIEGTVSRVSPEAPVMVLNATSVTYAPGGAANVAANLTSLGARSYLFGFVGNDLASEELRKILETRNITYQFGRNQITTLKERPRTSHGQLLRIDYEERSPKQFDETCMKALERAILDSELILVSDYAKGVVTPELMDYLKSTGKKIIVDPKPQNLALYKGVHLLKMNLKEALAMSHKTDVYEAGKYLRQELGSDLLVTLGEEGAIVFSDFETTLPANKRGVSDVTGAGDSFISALALSIASGASLKEAAIIANHAAGISVSNPGTYQVTFSELERSLQGDASKLRSLDELVKIRNDLRLRGKKVVWTNGCFDLLHRGHTHYLSQAKSLGDYLIVGLNSDASISRIKGEGRPINKVSSRAEVLSSLSCVDAIVVFEEDNCLNQLKALEPDFYVKGGDYNLESINQPERRLVESSGGKAAVVGGVPGVSTTLILEKLRQR